MVAVVKVVVVGLVCRLVVACGWVEEEEEVVVVEEVVEVVGKMRESMRRQPADGEVAVTAAAVTDKIGSDCVRSRVHSRARVLL